MKTHLSKIQRRGHLVFDMHMDTFHTSSLLDPSVPEPGPLRSPHTVSNTVSTWTRGHPHTEEVPGQCLGLDIITMQHKLSPLPYFNCAC